MVEQQGKSSFQRAHFFLLLFPEQVADYDLEAFPVVKRFYERLKKTLPYYAEINDLGIQQFKSVRS